MFCNSFQQSQENVIFLAEGQFNKGIKAIKGTIDWCIIYTNDASGGPYSAIGIV